MFPVINIGPLAIQAQGLILIIGFLFGIQLMNQFNKSESTNASTMENMIYWSLIAGIIAARLGFVLIHISVFLKDPLSIFSLSTTMLDNSFGTLVGVITALIYAQKKEILNWKTLDAIAIFLSVLAPAWFLSLYASGKMNGIPTNVSWAVNLAGQNRHPTQLYLFGSSLVFVIVILVITQIFERNLPQKQGIIGLSFLSWLCFSLLIIQPYFENSPIILNRIHSMQLFYWSILALSFYLMHLLLNKNYGDNQ